MVLLHDFQLLASESSNTGYSIPSLFTAAATRSSLRSEAVSGVWMPMMTRSSPAKSSYQAW